MLMPCLYSGTCQTTS